MQATRIEDLTLTDCKLTPPADMAYHHAKEPIPPSTNIGILSWPTNQSFDRCLNHQTGGHPRQSSQREPWPWPTFLHGRRVVGHRGSCLQRGNGACLTDDGQIICGRHFGRTNQRGLGETPWNTHQRNGLLYNYLQIFTDRLKPANQLWVFWWFEDWAMMFGWSQRCTFDVRHLLTFLNPLTATKRRWSRVIKWNERFQKVGMNPNI